jgi:hypothetical protein
MATSPPIYDIAIWLESREDPSGAARALVDALGDVAPAEARGVRATERGVVIEFPEMQAHHGEGIPGGRELSQAGLDRVLPVLRAMISLSAARVRAGAGPSERIVIDLKTSPVHGQQELRHS